MKDYQIDTLRRDITHVDLLAIDPNKEVVAEVPIEFVGKPAGAIDGGQIRIVLRELDGSLEAERHPDQAHRRRLAARHR